MKTLFLIPARGGSKGIPGKNIKLLAGKPLISYSIEAAKEVASIQDICISTDSEEIKKTSEKYGIKVPFIRPYEISTDDASSEEVMKHAVDFYSKAGKHYDTLALIQPTSPLRTAQHIKSAMKSFNKSTDDMVVSVCETKSNPYYVLFEEDNGGLLHKSKQGSFTRRQDCPKVYELNGAIYIININSLKEKGIKNFDRIKKFEMDRLSSVDIDDEIDWYLAEKLLNK
jgi:CMP-N,N'-diacetyllegionaminic acid synthase